ncbi:MAG: hypothetical protein ACMG6E_01800 [Candidatus Roizmanbacteria bacterium]
MSKKNKPNWSLTPQLWFIRYSEVCPIKDIISLVGVCRKFRDSLRHNLIWQKRSKSLPSYATLPSAGLTRIQPEFFWYRWYIKHKPQIVTIADPISANWICEVDVSSSGERLFPAVGTILIRNIGEGDEFFICLKRTVRSKIPNKGLPTSYTVSPLVKWSDGKYLHGRKVRYNSCMEISTKTGPYGNPTNMMQVLPNQLLGQMNN